MWALLRVEWLHIGQGSWQQHRAFKKWQSPLHNLCLESSQRGPETIIHLLWYRSVMNKIFGCSKFLTFTLIDLEPFEASAQGLRKFFKKSQEGQEICMLRFRAKYTGYPRLHQRIFLRYNDPCNTACKFPAKEKSQHRTVMQMHTPPKDKHFK